MTNDLDRLTESVCFLAQPVAALPSVQLPGLQTVSWAHESLARCGPRPGSYEGADLLGGRLQPRGRAGIGRMPLC